MDTLNRFATKEGDVAAKVIDGEAILINLGTGAYYTMGGVGGRVWSLIEQACNADEICKALASEYGTPVETVEADVHELIDQLLAEGLIGISDTNGASPVIELRTGVDAYAKPELRKFEDMAEMFALDPPLPGLAKDQA